MSLHQGKFLVVLVTPANGFYICSSFNTFYCRENGLSLIDVINAAYCRDTVRI